MLSSRDSREQCATLKPSRFRLLGVNAVIDSPEQIVHFACANLGFCIIERNSATEAVLRMFQPSPRLIDVAKNIRGVLEQSRKAHDLIRLVWRQPTSRFAPLQSGSRDRKFCCELLKWQGDAVLQSLQFRETQSLLNLPNQVSRMLCFCTRHFLFQLRSFHHCLSDSIETI